MNRKILVLLFLGMLAGPSFGLTRYRCDTVFSQMSVQKLDSIGFTQDFVGLRWVHYKLQKLQAKYEAWLLKNPEGNRQTFINQYVRIKKNLPAIRDIDGVVRLIDHHHSFYAIMLFGASASLETVPATIIKDYTVADRLSGRMWTARSMMEDLIQNGFVNFENNMRPSYQNLEQLPGKIFQLRDNPARSLLSLVLRILSPDFSLKGSDFTAHTQNQLMLEMKKQGIELFPEKKDPFSSWNLERVAMEILESKVLVQFLIDNISPSLGADRLQKVTEYLDGQLNQLNQN